MFSCGKEKIFLDEIEIPRGSEPPLILKPYFEILV